MRHDCFGVAGNRNRNRRCRFGNYGCGSWPYVSNCHISITSSTTKTSACHSCWISRRVGICGLRLYQELSHLHIASRFGQGGVAFFPFINGQIIDKAGINSMMPYTLGLAIAATVIWILVPSPVPIFEFISKWKSNRSQKAKDSLTVDKENSIIA